ncbi:hypothetical protein AB6A40_007746 [Gnathostoma spinigerum]|uniref:Uncharacterized protein n=1 Tax=Gnathostoma spinigerum TaxID=75299 RepID=A0ABD6EWT0_9BILA
MGPRDLFVDGIQVFRLLLVYCISLQKAGETNFELPGLTNYLYDNPFDDVHLMIFTTTKQFIGSSSVFPKRYTLKLDKGEYIVRAQIRHDDDSLLERYRDAVLIVKMKLASAINMECFDLEGCIRGDGNKLSTKKLKRNEVIDVFLSQIPEDKIPKNACAGSYLSGASTLPKLDAARSVVQYPVKYFFNEWGKKQAKGFSAVNIVKKKDDKVINTVQEMNDAARDVQIQWLSKFKDDSEAQECFDQLRIKYSDYLPLLQAMLKRLINAKNVNKNFSSVMSLADAVVAAARPDEVLAYLGVQKESNEKAVDIKT